MGTLATTYWWDTNQESEYNWDISDVDITGGGVLPELYGTMRVELPQSQIIAMNLDGTENYQYLSILWAICKWNIDDYNDVRINGEALTAYPEVNHPVVYYGLNNQPAIPDFALTKTNVEVDEELTVSPTYITKSISNSVTGFGVELSFPEGLYGEIQNGSSDGGSSYFETFVKVIVQYKLHSGSTWTNLTASKDGPSVVSESHWSGGYCSVDPTTKYALWVEIDAGSTTESDHTEGDPYDLDPGSWILSSYVDDPPGARAYTWHWVTTSDCIIPELTDLNSYVEINEQFVDPFKMTFSRTGLPLGAYDIRVCLYETPFADQGTVIYYNTVKFDSYVEILEDNFSYPNVALAAFKAIPTEKLNGSMPTIDMVVAKYYVYAYNPNTSAYEQKAANNPAWACYDMIHKYRPLQDDSGTWHDAVFGVPHEQLDPYWNLWVLWAAWCDWNGTAPYTDKKPYTFNHYFDQPISLQESLDIAATCGRGKVRQVGINFKPIFECPEIDITQRFLFSQGNISVDSFSETIDVSTDTANMIEVTYKEQGTEYTYDDETLLVAWGDDYDVSTRDIKSASVTLEGCTNREMAAAYGKYILNRNRYLTAVSSWTANIDSIHCEVGDIVEAPADFGGRLLAGCTTTSILLDQDFYYDGVSDYRIVINHYEDDLREESKVQLTGPYGSGFYDEIIVETPFSRAPSEYTKYVIGVDGEHARLRRIISISRDTEMMRKITAEEFNTHVFEDDAVIPSSPFNPYVWRIRPPAPTITINDLVWRLDSATKTWMPYISISVAADLSYLSIPVVKLKVWAHIKDGDTHTDPMGVTQYGYVFEWDSSISKIEAPAAAFNGKTIYLTVAYINAQGMQGPKGVQAVGYINTAFTPVGVEYSLELDDCDFTSAGSTAYIQYFHWVPFGWEATGGKYAPIMSWNDGNNYFVFDKYLIVYAPVASNGDVPAIDTLQYYTTPDIGNIYAADGSLITDADTLDQICRAAASSAVTVAYSDKYTAIACCPLTKNGATSPLDFTAADYGLDWDWFRRNAPGTTTVEEEEITNFELYLSVQAGAIFLNEMSWDYALQSPDIDGFAIMYRAQADWWFWQLSGTISAAETSLSNFIVAIDFFETGGGLAAVNSWAAAYQDWVNRGIPHWYMFLSSGTSYEIIKIDTTSPYAVTRGQEGTTAKEWTAGAAFSYAPCELIDTLIPLTDTTQRAFLLPSPLQINFALHLSICAYKLTAELPGYKRSHYAFWDLVFVDGAQVSTSKSSAVLIPIVGADGQVKAGNHFVSLDFQQDTPAEWTGLVWDSTGLIAGEDNIGLSGWNEGEQTVLISELGITKIPAGIGISYQSEDKPNDETEISVLLPYGITFPEDLVDSAYFATTGPAAEAVVSIKINGTEFATMTVAIGGTTTATWAGTETACVMGDRVSFVFPAQDATWAGVVITLKGIRS